MTAVKHISCTDTAKLIRKALKRRFPRTKFSVTSKTYSGGASIDVKWTDGPTEDLVRSVTGAYAGGRFDGMIDLAYSVYSWLMPDGTATLAKSNGTVSSGGTDDSEQYLQPSFKSELVRFGADYVFTERSYSPEFYRRAADKVAARLGVTIEVEVSAFGRPRVANDRLLSHGDWITTFMYRELARRMPAAV